MKKNRDKADIFWKRYCTYTLIQTFLSGTILRGNRFWTFLHLSTGWREQQILMQHGKLALGWLPSTRWHLYSTNRLIIRWLNKSRPFRIDFCLRQMMYTWHQEIRSWTCRTWQKCNAMQWLESLVLHKVVLMRCISSCFHILTF